MIKCGDCIYCVNQKNSPANVSRECHYNPPTDNGFPRVEANREGCRLGEQVKDVKKPEPINLPSPPKAEVVVESDPMAEFHNNKPQESPKRKPGRPPKK